MKKRDVKAVEKSTLSKIELALKNTVPTDFNDAETLNVSNGNHFELHINNFYGDDQNL